MGLFRIFRSDRFAFYNFISVTFLFCPSVYGNQRTVNFSLRVCIIVPCHPFSTDTKFGDKILFQSHGGVVSLRSGFREGDILLLMLVAGAVIIRVSRRHWHSWRVRCKVSVGEIWLQCRISIVANAAYATGLAILGASRYPYCAVASSARTFPEDYSQAPQAADQVLNTACDLYESAWFHSPDTTNLHRN